MHGFIRKAEKEGGRRLLSAWEFNFLIKSPVSYVTLHRAYTD